MALALPSCIWRSPFPHALLCRRSQCPSPAAALGMLPVPAFGGGFIPWALRLLLIHSFLSNDNDLKIISFYFPQIPPIVEASFFVIPLLI